MLEASCRQLWQNEFVAPKKKVKEGHQKQKQGETQ
jgi:hypothetical protein